MALLIIIILSWLIGGIPFGLIISRFWHKDPRQGGSGNIGATNVFRTAGKIPGILTVVADVLKGSVVVIGVKVYLYYTPQTAHGIISYEQWLPSLAAMAVVLGHIFSPYLKFRGGKGVATGLGTIIILTPFFSLLGLVVFLILVIVFKYISLGSISAALTILVVMSVFKFTDLNFLNISVTWGEWVFVLILAVFVILSHRSNIRRLLTGKENKFSWHRKSSP
jgi:acyl phosphate:glycerol-3-phosphate acyltransferase